MTAAAPPHAAPPPPRRTASSSRRSPFIAALAVPPGLLLAGCATTAPAAHGAPRGERAVPVVAAENFWGSVAARLGGDHAGVTGVTANPATDPVATVTETPAPAGATFQRWQVAELRGIRAALAKAATT